MRSPAENRHRAGVPARTRERGSGNDGARTETRGHRERVVGATAIASAALVLIDNRSWDGSGSPTYAAPMKEVLAFHADHRTAVAIAVGLEALNVPLLLWFVTGLHGLVGRRGGAGADWSRLAVAAGATLSAVMAFYAVLWDGVVLSAGELTEPSPVLELAWRMHAAAFAWSTAGARHHVHRRCAGDACQPADAAVAASARRGRGRPAARRRRGQPRDRRRLGAPVRRGVRLGSLARVADCDRRTAGARSKQLTVESRVCQCRVQVSRLGQIRITDGRSPLEMGYRPAGSTGGLPGAGTGMCRPGRVTRIRRARRGAGADEGRGPGGFWLPGALC